MGKVLVRLMTFMIVVAGLTTLIIISSCATSPFSAPGGGEVRGIFASATAITEMPISQDARVSGRPDILKASKITGASGILGYSIDSKVVSRSGPFKIRVLLDSQFYVKRATVISYPWDRGRDVCKRAFTSQFEGKGPLDPIQIGEDIDAMTGATISSLVMTEGVRDTIKLIKRSCDAGTIIMIQSKAEKILTR